MDVKEKKTYTQIIEQQHGLLLLDKPKGLSSAQCLNRIKRLGQKKIGHAGTLDPMATGLLLVLLGSATKLSNHLMDGGEKVYKGTVCLGTSTDTWDAEGTVVESKEWKEVSPSFVEQCIKDWQGTSTQEVPPYSAAKHQGKALYTLARQGLETPKKEKEVHISRVELVNIDLPSVTFRLACSSGTYIRSLAHSLGKRCGCGAMLTELVREYSHPFWLKGAVGLEDLLQNPELLPSKIVPIHLALDWPCLQADADIETKVRNGVALSALTFTTWADGSAIDHTALPKKVVLLDKQNKALALLEGQAEKQEWTVLRGLWTL